MINTANMVWINKRQILSASGSYLKSFKWYHSKEKCLLRCKYSRHLCKTTTITFTILPTSNDPDSLSIALPKSELAYLTLMFVLQLTYTASSRAVCPSWRIDKITKWANISYNSAEGKGSKSMVMYVKWYSGGRKMDLISSSRYSHKWGTIVFSIPGAILWV